MILPVLLASIFLLVESAPAYKVNKPLKKEDILPVDHVDSVKIELDGHLNRDYKREIFFGEEHDKIMPASKEEEQQVLITLFKNVDVDGNGKLTKDELVDWVMKKIKEHLDASANVNRDSFKVLDKNGDGSMIWRELLIEIMISFGHSSDLARRYADDHSLIKLDNAVADDLNIARHRWSVADINMDGSLNQTEFLFFRHPELSIQTQKAMAEELLGSMDRNNDGKISEEEFIKLPDKDSEVEVPFPGFFNDDAMWIEERKKQFHEVLDVDKDNFCSLVELTEFVKPDSKHNAIEEIGRLLKVGDANQDSSLSLEEFLAIGSQIIGSKMVNTAAQFHNEL